MLADTGSRILRLKTVLDRTGLSRSTLYRKMERGTFPSQVQISERCIGWRESELEQWLRNPMYYSRFDPVEHPLAGSRPTQTDSDVRCGQFGLRYEQAERR